MKHIENVEYVTFIVNDIVKDNYVDLNKDGNYTLENYIEKDDSIVTIQWEDEVNANEEGLLETSSMNEEEIIVDISNGLNWNLVINK